MALYNIVVYGRQKRRNVNQRRYQKEFRTQINMATVNGNSMFLPWLVRTKDVLLRHTAHIALPSSWVYKNKQTNGKKKKVKIND